MELRLRSSTLACAFCFFFSTRAWCSSFRASCLAFRCALRHCDLIFDIDRRPAHSVATQPGHRGVDQVQALLGDLRQGRHPRRLNLLRHLAQHRLGRLDIIDVEGIRRAVRSCRRSACRAGRRGSR